MRSEAWSNVT